METQVAGFRLSPQQRRLWSLRDASDTYRAQCAVLIEGDLKPEVLKAALQQVIMRHEILRTRFDRLSGMKMPVQVVIEDQELMWAEHDLTSAAPEEEQALIEEIMRSEPAWGPAWDPAWGLDIDEAAPVRTKLLRISPVRHALIVTLSPLCADASSLRNLVEETCRCYDASVSGSAPDHEVIQYSQYSEWQYELLEDDESGNGREYWAAQKANGQGALRLSCERRPAGAEFEPAETGVPVPDDLKQRLEEVALKSGAELNDCLLGCWLILLTRLTGQPDVTISLLCDGRKYSELRSVIGLLAKWLPLYFHLESEYRFADVLRRVCAVSEESKALIEYFAPEQAHDTHGFGFEFRSCDGRFNAAELSFSIVKERVCFERLKLRLSCVERLGALTAQFHYDANIFAADDIARLAQEFLAVMESVAGGSAGSIASLNILPESETEQLLAGFNNTSRVYATTACVHERFEQQVKRTPGNIAVTSDGRRLTYAQLNSKANQLARHLRELGVESESLVAIYMERSVEMLVGLLGIIKAGGAYLPIDPGYPKDRINFMLADSQAPVLLTQDKLAAGLQPAAATILCLDSDWDFISRCSDDDLSIKTAPENLVYVIYTSGSTGKPKGVMISHGGLANYLDWSTEAYFDGAGDGAPVHSPIGFDLTITSLFCPLVIGQRVDLIQEEEGIEGLSAVMRAGRYSVIKLTPSHLDVLAQWIEGEPLAGCARALVIGGEALFGEALGFWKTRSPHTRIINEYGPTETVVGCCVYEVKPDEAILGPVPIGMPIANTRIYILDRQGQPVPIGVTGELYIAGAGVARGYINRADVTAERFVPDPFSIKPGARLYRTGDLGQYRAGGAIEFLGRNDEQVKIRGFRIELGEVEAVLRDHPGVRDAVVIAQDDGLGAKRLIGYFAVKQEPGPKAGEIRNYLAERLPSYMIPSALVILKALPLTANGKVNRAALPAPDRSRPELEQSFIPPSTAIEQILASIWTEVLGIEEIGVNDSFFSLGGDSIRSVRVVALAKERGLNFSVQMLFQYQTIGELAREIETTAGLTGSEDSLDDLDANAMSELLAEMEGISEESVREMLREKMATAVNQIRR